MSSEAKKKGDDAASPGGGGAGGGTIVELVQNLAGPALSIASVVIPAVIVFVMDAYRQFKKLPQNVITFIIGAITCFFGGTFPTLFAAVQAAEHSGRKKVVQALSDLSEEVMIIIEESKKDDAEDNDGDGVKDVKQVAPKELMARKFRLVLRKMNPEKVDNALGELYRVWLSVSAVLAIQFARTISLALTIADSLDKPMNKHVAPVVKLAVPPEYQRWIPIVIGWVVKSVAMSFAFYVQSIVSATASALSGGLMMSQAIYHFCVARDFTLMGLLKENHADTYIDEVFAYVFAALGFYTQLRSGFDIKFPLNLVLFPFEWAEFWIRWTITRKVS